MSKDLPENIAYSSAADNTIANTQPGDILYSFMHAPVSKLDADQYMVSDLDGVTEGLFGSGNMNFLMMQSAQTNEAIQNTNPMDANIGGDGFASPLIGTDGSPATVGTTNQAGDLEFFNPLASPDDMNISSDLGLGTSGPGGAGGIGATTFAGHAQSQDPFYSARSLSTSDIDQNIGTNGNNGSNGDNGTSGPGGTNGNNGPGGTNGTNGTNGFNGNDGNDGKDGIGSGLDLGPIGLDLILNLSNLTDLTLNLINGDNVLNVINETIDLSPVLDPVTNLLGDIASGVNLGMLIDPLQYDDSPDDFDLILTSELDLLGLPLPPIGFDIPLDPVEFLLGDIDLHLGLTNDLLNGLPIIGGADDADTDLDLALVGDLLGNNLIDLPLDLVLNPVEDLVGDLDIGLGGGLDLLGNSEISNALGDTDITLPIDLNLAGQDLLSDVINVPLDPVEALVGDIDLDLTVAGDIIGNVADNLIDGFDGGSDDNNLLAQTGDIVGNLVDDLLPSTGDTDVSSDVFAGVLDNLPIVSDMDISLDTVENLVGDIDILSNVGLDLLGTSTGGTDGSSDVSLAPDLGLLNQGLLDDTIDVTLDPVESLLGDIDISEDMDIDLLHSMPDETIIQDLFAPIETAITDAVDMITSAPETLGNIGGITEVLGGGGDITGGLPIPSWTESTLPDAGDILGGGLMDDVSSLLPDPVASVTSLLPTVPIVPVITGGLGGLGGGGGHHFGGLFG